MRTSSRGVLFDMDDTLFDHAHATRASLQSLQQMTPALAVWPLDEFFRRHSVMLETMHREVLAGRVSIDDARTERFRRLLAEADHSQRLAAEAPRLARHYRDEYERAWRPVPGAPELLAALRAEGLRISIVTNNVRSEQELKLERCGLQPLVDDLVASQELGVSKPDPEIFRIALERLSLDRDVAVMVGDVWDTDIAGARAAGIRAVWFNWRRLPASGAPVQELHSLLPTGAALEAIASA